MIVIGKLIGFKESSIKAMKKRVDDKDVYYNIDGQEIDFSDYNIQEKITYESANFIRRLCAFMGDILIIICIWYLCSISTFNRLNDFVSQLGIDPSDFVNPQVLLDFARLYHQSIIKLRMKKKKKKRVRGEGEGKPSLKILSHEQFERVNAF